MRRSSVITHLLLISILVSLLSGCKKPVDDGNDIWPDDQEIFVTEVMDFQDQAGLNFSTWTKTMDSMAAVEKLRQYFEADPNVSYARVTSQGICVEYKNGTRGGIMLNTERGPGSAANGSGLTTQSGEVPSQTKSVVNNKKMILFDAAYSEVKDGQTFKYFTDQVIASHRLNLPKIKYTLDKVYTDEQATLERYTQLSGYGIIDLASHGFASEDTSGRYVDVYMLTGELAGPKTKYWLDVASHNMIIMQYLGKNKYWISERFISGHNNFSKDTVLIIGSFCHSYRCTWPNLQKSFAAGAYVGYTRKIDVDKCAEYDSDLIFFLSDTTKSPLKNIADWMNDPKYPKYYQSLADYTPVHVEFAGDSSLTLLPDTTTTVKDIDGNVYHVKKIGKQYWTVENLKTTRLNDGTAIPNVTDGSTWSKMNSMAYCWYNNDPVTNFDYGLLYNWFAVDTKKLAPKGWHVPTLADWYQMIDLFGGIYFAGSKLKETGTKHWKAPNDLATNSSGFTGLPGGTIYAEIWNNIYFNGKTMGGYFWTSTAHNAEFKNFFQLIYTYEVMQPNGMYPQFGMSVRCVRD